MMWNAGVLGFNSKKSNVLNDVLKLTDSMYPMFPKHVVEQLAFSFYFTRNGIVQAAEDWVYHYWDFKEFRSVLNAYFNTHQTLALENHLNNVEKLDPREWIKPKREFENQSGLKKLVAKLTGKNWQTPELDF